MEISYILVNRDIETVAANFFEYDYSEDKLYEGKDTKALKNAAAPYSPEDMTVISYGTNFFTGYSYKSWLRRFGK